MTATGRRRPEKDNTLNLRLLSGTECNGETTLTFSRDLVTCDAAQDLDITVSHGNISAVDIIKMV